MTCRNSWVTLPNAQPASVPKASVPKAEPATNAGVTTFNIATPRVPDASAAKAENELILEIKSPGVLAQEAKARLDELLKGGAPLEPAIGNEKPHLPTMSGFMTPTEPNKTPLNDSPKSVGKQQQVMGASDLIEFVKALTQMDEKDKPKTKEAEVIKLNNMPAPESYRNWKNHVRDEVKSCSDRPDEARAWLSEVYDQSCTGEKLEQKLQDPGKFLTLDTKLSAALTRSPGEILPPGSWRYVLLMFEPTGGKPNQYFIMFSRGGFGGWFFFWGGFVGFLVIASCGLLCQSRFPDTL